MVTGLFNHPKELRDAKGHQLAGIQWEGLSRKLGFELETAVELQDSALAR